MNSSQNSLDFCNKLWLKINYLASQTRRTDVDLDCQSWANVDVGYLTLSTIQPTDFTDWVEQDKNRINHFRIQHANRTSSSQVVFCEESNTTSEQRNLISLDQEKLSSLRAPIQCINPTISLIVINKRIVAVQDC